MSSLPEMDGLRAAVAADRAALLADLNQEHARPSAPQRHRDKPGAAARRRAELEADLKDRHHTRKART